MTVIDNRTANRNYQLPNGANDLEDDVLRLVAAIGSIDADVAGLVASLAGKAATSHTHVINDVSGLQAALDGKLDAGAGGFAPLNSPGFTGTPTGPTASSVTNTTQLATTAFVQERMGTRAPTSHTHSIADVTSLQTTLDGKFSNAGGSLSGAMTITAGTAFTTSSWSARVKMDQGAVVHWLKGSNAASFGFGVNADTFSWVKSTADNNSAASTALMSLDASGNLTAVANVTAFSDERVKDLWVPLPMTMLYKLADMKFGTYSRTDLEPNFPRQVGVGAQSLETFMPEAVVTDQYGMKSVAYGNAAMAVACLLAREFLGLRREWIECKARITALEEAA